MNNKTKSIAYGNSFSNLEAFLISVSLSKNQDLLYLLKQRTLMHVRKSKGSTSNDFDEISNDVTAVNYNSLLGLSKGAKS